LGEEYVEEWKRYRYLLVEKNLILKEEEDQLIMSLNPNGEYVPRLGYNALVEEGREK